MKLNSRCSQRNSHLLARRSLLHGTVAAAVLGLPSLLTASVRPASRPPASTSAGPQGSTREGPRRPAPDIAVCPVAPERAAVTARVPSGVTMTVECDGAKVSARAARDVAVVGVAVKKGARSTLRISVPGYVTTKTVDTGDDSLRKSLLRIVNKRIALTKDDEPEGLVSVSGVMIDRRVQQPLTSLARAAKAAGAELTLVSGHRSYGYQEDVYGRYRSARGQAAADQFSARPGHSEHQLGLAVDVREKDGATVELVESFAATKAGRWLAAHAHEFGFVIRYPKAQEKVTGYEFEPWHLRFVGCDVARYLWARPDVQTLEKLFGLPDAPGY